MDSSEPICQILLPQSDFAMCTPIYFIKMLMDQGTRPHSVLLWMGLVLFAITVPGLSTAKDVPLPVDSAGHVIPHTFLVCYHYSLHDINPKLSSQALEPCISSLPPFADVA